MAINSHWKSIPEFLKPPKIFGLTERNRAYLSSVIMPPDLVTGIIVPL